MGHIRREISLELEKLRLYGASELYVIKNCKTICKTMLIWDDLDLIQYWMSVVEQLCCESEKWLVYIVSAKNNQSSAVAELLASPSLQVTGKTFAGNKNIVFFIVIRYIIDSENENHEQKTFIKEIISMIQPLQMIKLFSLGLQEFLFLLENMTQGKSDSVAKSSKRTKSFSEPLEELGSDSIKHHDAQTTYEISLENSETEKLMQPPPSSEREKWTDDLVGLPGQRSIYTPEGDQEQEVVSGSAIDNVRDRPGQRTIYIPPGNSRSESYRLSTFEEFSITDPNTRKKLAKSGFYFTGFSDQVTCFNCSSLVSDIGDDPAVWHKASCSFKRGDPCGNVPIVKTSKYIPTHSSSQIMIAHVDAVVKTTQPVPTWRMANVASSDHKRFLTNLYLNRELDRLASFARWQTDRPNVPPSALAKTGFFYLGDMDRVQCFSCGGVLRNWTVEDSPELEHRTHFSRCNMVLGNEGSNVPIPSRLESPELLATNYPMRFPSNPHMTSQAQREATFDRRWPAGRNSATIEQIAEAGFFYLGERDRVKCFYCNGGLQNWEYDDMPWEEHAKWFPNCQFLLQTKGQRFVHRHLAPHAQLPRQVIGRQDGSPLENMRNPTSFSQRRNIHPVVRRPPTPPPAIIDPQEEMRRRKERVKNIMKNSEFVKSVLRMGFSVQIVETVVEDRILAMNVISSNDIYGSVSTLLDDVLKKEEEIRQEEEQRRNEILNPSEEQREIRYNCDLLTLYESDDLSDDDLYGEKASNRQEGAASSARAHQNEGNTEALQQQLNRIAEERMCKICYSKAADMSFCPCLHMVCCMDCTPAITHCPVCGIKIIVATKIY